MLRPLLLRRTGCCFAPFTNGAHMLAAPNSKPKSSVVAGKFGVESPPANEKLPPALLVLNGLVGLPASAARRVTENDSAAFDNDILRVDW